MVDSSPSPSSVGEGRHRSHSVASSVLSDPPSDIDDQEYPFDFSSSEQTSAFPSSSPPTPLSTPLIRRLRPRGSRSKQNSSPPSSSSKRQGRRVAELIAHQRPFYKGEQIDESPQEVWERRFNKRSALLPPRHLRPKTPPAMPTEAEKQIGMYREMLVQTRDEAKEVYNKMRRELENKAKKVERLEGRIENLEGTVNELKKKREELFREIKKMKDAKEVAITGNSERDRVIEGLRKAVNARVKKGLGDEILS